MTNMDALVLPGYSESTGDPSIPADKREVRNQVFREARQVICVGLHTTESVRLN